jgi:two-component system OmpR family sensor kinase
VSRVPIRLRVTLAFTAAMAVVLVAVGLFVYLRLEAELDASVEGDAPARAGETRASEREESFDEALDSLGALLLVGGPAALLLASLAGYAAAGAALRPVEAMRRRASEISASGPEERLPVPAANDELRRLGQTLNEMLARIEATLERERRFVDDASHELRTPLALHKAELELALRHGDGEAELRAAIASGLEEVDRLAQLATDLLVVARSGEGDLQVSAEPVRVGELLAAVAKRFEARASESGRSLTVGEGGDLRVSGDRLRLEQALTGMVDNALRHGRGAVRLWARAGDGTVELHVGDRGDGFPPEYLPRAFERLSRGDAARARGGSGLGLAIVAATARAHGGDAGAANDPGGGADVWIVVPAT